jgi:tRNA(Ile)-lysidine synthase
LQRSPKLSKKAIAILKEGKNLLAFSGGVDSSALFFLLMENDISFDLAIVDYRLRSESYKEVAYAKELALKYKKELFIKVAKSIKSNFEFEARKIRYSFFEELIKSKGYQNLLTAHQLNDRLEWFFMQFSKGAGTVELLGFDEIEKRDGFLLIRPLIDVTKDELQNYLESKKIKYFIDKTNIDEKYKRNYIRNNFSNRFLKEFKNGVIKSFEYLQNDKNRLFKPNIIFNEKELFILEDLKDNTANIRQIDKIIKSLGYILSKKQRDEILRIKDVVISDKIAIVFSRGKIYIAPFIKIAMDKKFKEECRKKKIPPKIRPYLLNLSLTQILQ